MKRILGLLTALSVFQLSLQQNLGSSKCGEVTFWNNGNGGANTCPGVNGSPIASNVIGTAYATVPPYSKTGNVRLNWPAGTGTNPPVISNVWEASSQAVPYTAAAIAAGPPSPVGLSTGGVTYCFYTNTNYNLTGAAFLKVCFSCERSSVLNRMLVSLHNK